MKNKVLSKLFASLGFLAVAFTLVPQAEAIGIRPIRYEANVKPGGTVEGTVTVVNETDADFSAKPTLLTFYKNDQNGFPVFVTEKNPELQDVSQWVELSEEPVLVPAKGSTDVKYKINVPNDATPGGKYISIAYQPVKDPTEGVTVNVRAASLILLNVEGEVIRKGEVTDFNLPEERYSDQPFNFNITFVNSGNTHVKPTGFISIMDMDTGKKLTNIAKYVQPETNQEVSSDALPVNLYQTNVLPDSDRLFSVPWTENIKEGKLKAMLELSYDQETPPIQQEFEFEIKDDVRVEEFKINTAEGKADFTLKVRNEGVGQQKLMGSIIVSNTFGYTVAEIPLAEDMDYIAPGETKELNLSWLDKEVPSGRYTAELNATYGFTKKQLNSEITFGEIDKTKLLLVIALVVVTIIALFGIFRGKRKGRR